jgi:nucleoid DNA-binding protein
MNKSELIDAVAAKVSELPKKAIGEVLNAFATTVGESLKGDDIALIGFSTFCV